MKALFVSAGVLIGLSTTAPAGASVISVGGSLAESCYKSADARVATRQSISECDRALRDEALTANDRAATYVNRGILRLLNEDYGAADADFDQAILVNATEPEAWLNKGIFAFKQGNGPTAVPLVARAIELRTRRPALAFYVRGLANEEGGNVKAAYADFVRARDLAPKWSLPVEELKRYQVRRP